MIHRHKPKLRTLTECRNTHTHTDRLSSDTTSFEIRAEYRFRAAIFTSFGGLNTDPRIAAKPSSSVRAASSWQASEIRGWSTYFTISASSCTSSSSSMGVPLPTAVGHRARRRGDPARARAASSYAAAA